MSLVDRSKEPDPNLDILVVESDGMPASTFPLSNKVKRALWNVVYILLFRWTPRPAHGWRVMLLRLFRAKLGKRVRISGKAIIWAPWNLEMADDSAIAEHVNVYSMAKIRLDQGAIVSQGANLCAGTHDYTRKSFQLYALPITIGEKAWVCTEAFIGPGVTIGAGSVIGARAVCMRDMPEWMVCGGHPCQPIKPRVMKD